MNDRAVKGIVYLIGFCFFLVFATYAHLWFSI